MSVVNAPPAERRSRAVRAPSPAGKGLDRALLLDELRRCMRTRRRSGRIPARGDRLLQAALAEGRSQARKALEAGGTGRACAETLSAQIDDLLSVALDLAARWLAPAPAGTALPTVVAVGGYGRGHAGAGLRHRPPVPAAGQADAGGREDRRGAALRALGPQTEGRPRDPHDRRVPEAGARRHDDPHHADRGASRHRRPEAVRDAAGALRQGDRRQDRARIRRRQARRARGARQAGGRVALSRRTQRQGRQGRPARPQHAVLDLEIRLSGPEPA